MYTQVYDVIFLYHLSDEEISENEMSWLFNSYCGFVLL